MDLHLRDSAGFAEDVAAGLRQFREHLPEYGAEITDLIADLYAISATLTSLEGLTRQFRHNFQRVKPDLALVRSSLQYTLDDIFDAFGKLDDSNGARRPDAYRRIWLDLNSCLREESSCSLNRRLRKYKMFLQEVQDHMQNKLPDLGFMADLRRDITELLLEQDGRFAARLTRLSLDDGPASSGSNSTEPGSPLESRVPGKRRSYERARPGIFSSRLPQSPPFSPTSSQGGAPPYVPDVPGSPTSTSTTTQSNLSAAILNDHWARLVFTGSNSVTGLPSGGEISKCLGQPTSDIKDWLHEEGFDEIAYLPSEDGSNLSVYFYIRDNDSRARIMCKVRRARGASQYFCLPLNLLEARRVGSSCLQLCRRRRSGTELSPWLHLKFRTIERMVTFFCTFLALRSQDAHRQVHDIRDYELDNEEEIFGGLITDDNYRHALRIYRDRISGAVRLQASVHDGEMKRAPVWTAHITQSISSATWCRRASPTKVLVHEIRHVVFSTEYVPPRNSRGEYVIQFLTAGDAEGFVHYIREVAGRA